MYEIISTFHDALVAKAAAEAMPETRTSSVNEGVEAFSQLVKTTCSMQQQRHSCTGFTTRVWHGDVTLLGAKRGGVPPAMKAEREGFSVYPPHNGTKAELGVCGRCANWAKNGSP